MFCVLRLQLPCCISCLQFMIHRILWCLVLSPAIEMSRNPLQCVPSSDFPSHLLMLSVRSKSQLPWECCLSELCHTRLWVFPPHTRLPWCQLLPRVPPKLAHPAAGISTGKVWGLVNVYYLFALSRPLVSILHRTSTLFFQAGVFLSFQLFLIPTGLKRNKEHAVVLHIHTGTYLLLWLPKCF